DFQRQMGLLGLRRDKYLNMILPEAISWLRQAQQNSPTAERFWRSVRDVRASSLQKVAILLDPTVLADMNEVCAEKRVPRGQFFQRLLDTLVTVPSNGMGPAPLPYALELIQNPWQAWHNVVDGHSETPFDEIIMPDLTEKDLLEALADSGLPRT